MKLRAQLVIAFLILAVLPLGAITLYSYRSSTRALRRAVETESARAATEMESRMTRVTANLSRRIDQLESMPLPVTAQAPAPGGGPDPVLLGHLLGALGDTVGYIEAFEFIPVPGLAQEGPAGSHAAAPPAAAPPAPAGAPAPPPADLATIQAGAITIHLPHMIADLAQDPEMAPLLEKAMALVPRMAGSGGASGAGAEEGFEEQIRTIAQVIRTRLEKAGVAAEQARIAREIADRGRYDEATPEPPEGPGETRVSLKKEFACQLKSNGKTLGKLKAKVRTERLLHEVLSQTHRDVGEIPFAVDEDGNLFTLDKGDVPKLKEIARAAHARRGREEGGTTAAAGDPSQEPEERIALASERPNDTTAGTRPEEQPGGPIDLSPDENWVVVTRSDPATGFIFGMARPVGESLGEIRRASARNLGAGLALASLALFGIMPLSRRMTQNLSDLTAGAERLAAGDLDTQVPIRSRDELGQLARVFNRMARDLRANQKRLVEQERLQKELELCRRIQAELLPREPYRCDYAEVEGLSIPARELGGDFFNYFGLPDGSLAIVMGDVSGKGLPAAMLMCNLQATLRARVPVEGDLAEFAACLDREVEASTPPEVYVTLLLCVVDPARREMRYVNAGHESPYVLRHDGRIERLEPTGRPVGLVAGGAYREQRVPLAPGDRLLLYTDGLVDAEDSSGTQFGWDRLETLLEIAGGAVGGGARDSGPARGARPAPRFLLDFVERAYREYRGGVEAADDATLLVLGINSWPAEDRAGAPLRLVGA